MKKCAYCGCPNEDTEVGCAECGEQLETSSSPDPEPQALDPALSPVIVAQFTNLQQASVLAGRLEAAGIQASIPEEYSEQIFSGVIGLERLTVRVAAKDYKAAMAVVAEGVEATSTSVPPGSSGTEARPERGWPRWVRQKRATRKPASCANPVAQKSQRLPICAQNAGGRNQIKRDERPFLFIEFGRVPFENPERRG